MSLRVLVLVWSICCCGAPAVSGNSAGPSGLRLVGGPTRCQGEVQVQRGGPDWNKAFIWSGVPMWFGGRVCAALDCGRPRTVTKKTVPYERGLLLSSLCDDPSLMTCFESKMYPSDIVLEVNCSDSLRLVGGRSLCSGSLQTRDQSLSQSWTPVCEGALDRRGAEVLCRELGCGAPLLQGALSPLGQTFLCEGHESALMDCPRNQTRTEPGTCSPLHFACSEPVKLVGGASRCDGTVEVKHLGQWRRLMTSPYHWELESAAAVCRVLDCGSAVLSTSRKDQNWTKGWSLDAFCLKKNISVMDCLDADLSQSISLELVCSDSVRLVGGRSLCSGSLQIWDQSLAQSWTPVCEGALDRRGAEVLCRELGCGAPLLQGALSPLGQTFLCEGHESALMDCPRNQTRTEPGTCSPLHLTCSELVRLVDGPSRCEGTVELSLRGEWRRVKPVFPNEWDLESVSAVCRDVDCGSAVSAVRKLRSSEKIDMWEVRTICLKENAAVRHCVLDGDTDYDERQVVTCLDSVRLVGGRSLCSGSLQILAQSSAQSWTPVCEGALDRRGAEVLCRELGCGAPLLQGALSPLGQTFLCEGHESALMDCPRNQTRTEPGTCSPLHLTCSEPVRLVGGASRCEGTLEVKHRGTWRRVAPPLHRHWDLEAADVACRVLDCGSAVSADERRGYRESDVWGVDSKCVTKTAVVKDCVFNLLGNFNTGLELLCSDSVRLVGGRSLCSGSLQTRDQSLAQSWTPVCEGALDRRGAEVLCRELGCGAPLLQGALSPLGQTFLCEGHESALMDCPKNQTRTEPGTCSPLHLTCSEPLRLVGGASRCEGTLEVQVRGQWRRAESSAVYEPWDLVAAGVACRDLACGSAVSTERREGFNQTEVWDVSAECVKTKKTALKDCVFARVSESESGLSVVCSGDA